MTRLNWDADGQLVNMYGPCFEGLRQHKWDEAGQLVASYGDGTAGYFGYDGNGERVYKLRGTMTVEQINAGREHVSMLFTYPTLYVNPYMVITPQGYTKYYYSGTDRVAAQIGKVSHMQAQYTQSDTIAGLISKSNTFMQSAIGLFDSYIANIDLLSTISGDPIFEFLNPRCGLMTTLQRVISTVSLQNQLLPVVSGDVSGMETDPLEPALYYYHADHLGSATWITDSLGNPAQFLQYLPYGELWKNQKPMGYDERFKYTGKERDEETGYDYFGARYYTSAISGWLSPDPLMDKYPDISPYAYCNWNPLKYVDPDGKEKKAYFHRSQTAERYFSRNFIDDNRLHIFTHGNAQGIRLYLPNRNKPVDIPATADGAPKLSFILSSIDKSQLWSNYLNGNNEEPLQVVFHGCYTATMAEAMSKVFPDVYFTGTTEENHSKNGIELGPYSTYTILGIFKTDRKKKDGAWQTYINGELFRTEVQSSATTIKTSSNE